METKSKRTGSRGDKRGAKGDTNEPGRRRLSSVRAEAALAKALRTHVVKGRGRIEDIDSVS